jgi:DNA-binding beta-propeller fold protein YncE
MRFRRASILITISVGLYWLLIAQPSWAHPASGIVVDAQGNVYFVYSNVGVLRINPGGSLSYAYHSRGGHWLALDAAGVFSRARLPEYERITPDGAIPALIFASGGAPLVVGADGYLYYGSNGSAEESFPTGALTVARLSPQGQRESFSPLLKQKLAELKDGITGIAAGPGGSIYVATWNGIVVLNADGSIARIVNPLRVSDCDVDPADHNPANASSPLFRGLGVDSEGNAFVAATSCHRVVEITPQGRVSSILKSERPWSPTGVAVSGGEIYVLEYTNANGPKTEGWVPRVRKRAPDGTWTTLGPVPPETPPAAH